MSNEQIQLGTVPYLNAAPLLAGLSQPLRRSHPRQLAQQLIRGDIELALLSTSVLFEHHNLYLVPGMAIGCRGPVQSVKLFFNKDALTIENINRIILSPNSNSANQLTRILFPKAEFLDGQKIEKLEIPDAEVVIGDDALVRPDAFGSIDIGQLWWERTGLPFVFAAWISRSPHISRSLWEQLHHVKQSNLKNLNTCLDQMTEPYPLDRNAQIRYLQDNIHYDLGDTEMRGLARFREECITHKLMPAVQPIHLATII